MFVSVSVVIYAVLYVILSVCYRSHRDKGVFNNHLSEENMFAIN